MTWYKEFDFEDNPLSIKPGQGYELFFDDKNLVTDVLEKIKDSENLVLKGPLGTGKTSILKKIIEHFGGSRKLYYYNAYSASSPLDYERILKRAGNFFSRIFNLKSKGVILFIDEAQHLPPRVLEELKEYIDYNFKSVVLSSSDTKFKVPKELQKNFELEINTGNFTQKDAFNIIKDRLGGDYEEIISDDEIKKCYKNVSTQREFLLEVEKLCRVKHEQENS